MNRSTCTSSSKDLKREHSIGNGRGLTQKECHMDLDTYAFSKQPGFAEAEMRKRFKQAVPLRTVVVYCYDPRAVNVPQAIAKAMPGEVYPGEILRDPRSRKIASTTTIFPVVVAGGRAVDALRSITV